MDVNPSGGGVAGAPEILRADPRLRRQAMILLVVVTALGSAAIQWLLPWANATVEEAVRSGMPRSAVCKSTLAVLSVFAFAVAAFGLHTARMGRRIRAAGQFPLPGARVIRDTRVIRGRAADMLGRAQTFLGAALIVLCAALVALTSYGLAKLTTH